MTLYIYRPDSELEMALKSSRVDIENFKAISSSESGPYNGQGISRRWIWESRPNWNSVDLCLRREGRGPLRF
jgi:hypothetical protein